MSIPDVIVVPDGAQCEILTVPGWEERGLSSDHSRKIDEEILALTRKKLCTFHAKYVTANELCEKECIDKGDTSGAAVFRWRIQMLRDKAWNRKLPLRPLRSLTTAVLDPHSPQTPATELRPTQQQGQSQFASTSAYFPGSRDWYSHQLRYVIGLYPSTRTAVAYSTDQQLLPRPIVGTTKSPDHSDETPGTHVSVPLSLTSESSGQTGAQQPPDSDRSQVKQLVKPWLQSPQVDSNAGPRDHVPLTNEANTFTSHIDYLVKNFSSPEPVSSPELDDQQSFTD